MADELDDLLARGERGTPPPAAKGGDDLDDLLARGEAKVDMSPSARGRAAAPPSLSKSDEELGLDRGPQFYRGLGETGPTRDAPISAFHSGIVPTAAQAPGTAAYASRHAGDEMNDPGAQMITGGALAAPGAALVGAAAPAALAPMLSGAAAGGQQAAMVGANPVTGAILGALPGAGRAMRAADTAVGEKAVELATRPGLKETLAKTGKVAGGTVGGIAGTAKAGPIGTYIGVKGGAHVGEKIGEGIHKAIEATARRRMVQEAAEKMAAARAELAQAAELPTAGSALSDRAARSVANTISADAQRVAPGARPVPRATGFTANPPPVPERPAMVAPAARPPVATSAARRLQILDENGRDLIANPPTPAESLRADVARDAQRFKSQPYDVDEPAPAPQPDVGGQLDQSLQVLNLMKQAKDAGTLTPTLVRSAVKLGMPAQTVLKIVGPEDFKAAMNPVASPAASAAAVKQALDTGASHQAAARAGIQETSSLESIPGVPEQPPKNAQPPPEIKHEPVWIYRKGNGHEASFRSGGVPYKVNVRPIFPEQVDPEIPSEVMAGKLSEAMGENVNEFSFYNIHDRFGDTGGTGFGITGSGHAKQVISMASDAFRSSLRKFSPKVLTYTAAEPSRIRLYEALSSRLGHTEPYVAFRTAENIDGKAVFFAVKKSAVGEFESAATETGIAIRPVARSEGPRP